MCGFGTLIHSPGGPGPAHKCGAQPSPADAQHLRAGIWLLAHLPAGASPSFAASTKYSHSQLYRLSVRPIVLGRLEVTAPGAALHCLRCQARWTSSRSPLSIRLEPGLYCGNSQAKIYSAKPSRGRTPTCHHFIPVPRIRPPR